MTYLLTIILAAVCFGGVLLTALQLPGIWLIVAAVLAYAWYFDWAAIGPWTVVILSGAALLAEAGETLAAMWLANKAGASRRASWWALVGGLAGAFLLTIPIPIIGTIIGAAIGCFAGAFLAETSQQTDAATGARIGAAAALGRVAGSVLKIFTAITISAVAIIQAIIGWP
ncbi:MAG: DUF456 domain-containing protein [bacterium]|nr:DUF456 domain-containing protein [bacterium]